MKHFVRTKDKLHEAAYNFERLQQSLNTITALSYAPTLTNAVRTFRFDFYSFAKASVEVRNTLLNELEGLSSKHAAKVWLENESAFLALNPFWTIIYNLRNVSVHEGNKTPSFTFIVVTKKGIGKFTLNYSGRNSQELAPNIEITPHEPITLVTHYTNQQSGELTAKEEQELYDAATVMVLEFKSSMTKRSSWTFHSINFDDLELSPNIFLNNCIQLKIDFEKLLQKAERDFN